MNLAGAFSTQIRVYAEDTDMMGIVYHANYLRFFERARTDMLRVHQYSLTQLSKDNCHFAIAEARIRFHAPARLDDQLIIVSEVIKKTPCSLLFSQTMSNEHRKRVCEAEIKVVCIDGDMKIRRLPQNLK